VETYVYPADRELTAENIKQFLADVKEHKLVCFPRCPVPC
jgi:hypothetical protein